MADNVISNSDVIEASCPLTPMFHYTWPGREEAYACYAHARKLQSIAGVMGFGLQITPIELDKIEGLRCSQKLSKANDA